MRIGTCNFVSESAAVRYYRDYYGADTPAEVARMLADGEIHIGIPALHDDEWLVLLDNGARYGIEWEE